MSAVPVAGVGSGSGARLGAEVAGGGAADVLGVGLPAGAGTRPPPSPSGRGCSGAAWPPSGAVGPLVPIASPMLVTI